MREGSAGHGMILLPNMHETGLTADVISFSKAISACKEGPAVEENIDAASQNAQRWHDCQYDQLQCSHLSVRKRRVAGTSIDVAASMLASLRARRKDSGSRL